MGRAFTYIILGGGVSAGYAAREFVNFGVGFGELCIVSEESVPPYERPALSKGYLAPDGVRLPAFYTCVGTGRERQTEKWYAEKGIELLLSTPVISVNLSRRELVTQSGENLSFKFLIVATGAKALRLEDFGVSVEPSCAKRVCYLRNICDADCLVRTMATCKGGRAVVIGGGYIGMEAASALTLNGIRVTMVFPEGHCMARLFSQEIAAFYEDEYRGRGVEIVKGTVLTRVQTDAQGNLSSVLLKDGRSLPADMLVVGIGISPRTELFQNQIALEKGGIKVNAFLQSVSHPYIYAVGDVATFPASRFPKKERSGTSASSSVVSIFGKSAPIPASVSPAHSASSSSSSSKATKSSLTSSSSFSTPSSFLSSSPSPSFSSSLSFSGTSSFSAPASYQPGVFASLEKALGGFRRLEHVDHARKSAELAVRNIYATLNTADSSPLPIPGISFPIPGISGPSGRRATDGGDLKADAPESVENIREKSAVTPVEYDYLPYFYSRVFNLSWQFYGENVGNCIVFWEKSKKKFGAFWVYGIETEEKAGAPSDKLKGVDGKASGGLNGASSSQKTSGAIIVGSFLEGGSKEDYLAIAYVAKERVRVECPVSEGVLLGGEGVPAFLKERGLRFAKEMYQEYLNGLAQQHSSQEAGDVQQLQELTLRSKEFDEKGASAEKILVERIDSGMPAGALSWGKSTHEGATLGHGPTVGCSRGSDDGWFGGSEIQVTTIQATACIVIAASVALLAYWHGSRIKKRF